MTPEIRYRNSSGAEGQTALSCLDGGANASALLATGRGETSTTQCAFVVGAPSNQRVGSSNLSGRVDSDAVFSTTPNHLERGDAGFLPRRCVDAGLVQAAYTSLRMKRPRGFAVLGMHFSLGLPLLSAVFVLGLAAASVQQEREAQRDLAELRAQRIAALTLAAECVDDEIVCESVLTTCTNVLGDGLSCACWQPVDEDGAR